MKLIEYTEWEIIIDDVRKVVKTSGSNKASGRGFKQNCEYMEEEN